VEAMGGKISIVAEFPHQKPVVLSGIGALETDSGLSGNAKQHHAGN